MSSLSRFSPNGWQPGAQARTLAVELEELRRLSENATPGPWRQAGTKAKPHWYVTSDTAQVHGNLPPTREDYTPETINRWIADAALIVAAVNYVRSVALQSQEAGE